MTLIIQFAYWMKIGFSDSENGDLLQSEIIMFVESWNGIMKIVKLANPLGSSNDVVGKNRPKHFICTKMKKSFKFAAVC